MPDAPASPTLHVHADLEQLSRACAERWGALCSEAIAQRGAFHVALAGGSTPRRLYALLAGDEFSPHTDWSRVHVYFGDERSVPPDHPDSNYRMAREQLLAHVPVPEEHIHPILVAPESAEQDAAHYARTLRCNAPLGPDGIPHLDLMLLGVGPDGHTASLFPDTPILDEKSKLVAAVYVERLQTWRVSMTFPVLNRARYLLFQAAGTEKAEVVGRLFGASDERPPLPVQRLRPEGSVEWHVDHAAAAGVQP
ncbi:MAG TPA: 6-phosphogluconolactonase [Gammaproteobacteria bacterium]|nr:6-phosphogluconolactonase [Gammaproteobacteria bacterium]